MPKARSDKTHVYFVQPVDGGLVKIGKADDPHRRLVELQCGSPVRLRLCHFYETDRDMELRLHMLFAKYREHGEWFRPCPLLASLGKCIADPSLTDEDVSADNLGSVDYQTRIKGRREYLEWAERARNRPPDPPLTEEERLMRLTPREPVTALPLDANPEWEYGARREDRAWQMAEWDRDRKAA